MAEYAPWVSASQADAIDRVTGRMVYADDMRYRASWPAKSSVARSHMGRIRRLDVSKAEVYRVYAMVMTAQDAPTCLWRYRP